MTDWAGGNIERVMYLLLALHIIFAKLDITVVFSVSWSLLTEKQQSLRIEYYIIIENDNKLLRVQYSRGGIIQKIVTNYCILRMKHNDNLKFQEFEAVWTLKIQKKDDQIWTKIYFLE